MALDPTDPGAVALESRLLTMDDRAEFDFTLGDHRFTPQQVRRFNEFAIGRTRANWRLELLSEGWIRLSLIGPGGDPVEEDTYLAP